MLGRRSDLPLDRDAISRFLPWLIAFMVFLAVLALAGSLVLGSMAARWDRGMSGTLTVQIAPSPPGADRGADRTARALKVLRATPGVARAEPIDEGRMLALLEPWLGSGVGAVALPLPRLIDVI